MYIHLRVFRYLYWKSRETYCRRITIFSKTPNFKISELNLRCLVTYTIVNATQQYKSLKPLYFYPSQPHFQPCQKMLHCVTLTINKMD